MRAQVVDRQHHNGHDLSSSVKIRVIGNHFSPGSASGSGF